MDLLWLSLSWFSFLWFSFLWSGLLCSIAKGLRGHYYVHGSPSKWCPKTFSIFFPSAFHVLDSVTRSKHLKSLSLKKVSPTKNREHLSLPTSASNFKRSFSFLNYLSQSNWQNLAQKNSSTKMLRSQRSLWLKTGHRWWLTHLSMASFQLAASDRRNKYQQITAERTQHTMSSTSFWKEHQAIAHWASLPIECV